MTKQRGPGKNKQQKATRQKKVYILSENYVSFVIAGGRLARFFSIKMSNQCTFSPVLLNRYDLRFRFRLWKSFDFGSGSRQYLTVLQKQKFAQNLSFSMSEAAYFPGSWPFIFDLTFFVDPKPESSCIPVSVPLSKKLRCLRFRF
jgi:hypothetical protein